MIQASCDASRVILAIDIGGSKILSAIVTISVDTGRGRRAELSSIARRPLDRLSGKEAVWESIIGAVNETMASVDVSLTDVDSIGVTIPGVADPYRGNWVYAPFSGIRDFPIADKLTRLLGKRVYADNDVNACAWGEKIFGVCQNVDNYLWITISNGIGGGLVLDGKIYPGKFSGAAEIGHLNVIEDGALCGCGNRGCLEATAAGPGIARAYRELVRETILGGTAVSPSDALEWVAYLGRTYGKTNIESIFPDGEISAAEKATAVMIADEARRGNPLALAVYRNVGKYVGRAASWVANLINPEKIIIGGGVAGSFDLFYPTLWETFQRCLFKQTNESLTIEKTGLGYEAGLLGAASLAYDNPYKRG